MTTTAQLASDLAKLTTRVTAAEANIAKLTTRVTALEQKPVPVPPPVPASPIDTGMLAHPVLPDILVTDVPVAPFTGVDPALWTAAAAKPPQNTGDVVGAFRLTAQATHMSNADSLAFPGIVRPGNHHHTYWGNPLSDAFSTYATLTAKGVGSGEGGPLNRSSKWMPSLLTGDMRVVVPDYITEYYKQMPSLAAAKLLAPSDQAFIAQHRVHIVDVNGNDTGRLADTVMLPAALRFIVGNIFEPAYLAGTLGSPVLWHLYDPGMNLILEGPHLGDLLAKMVQGTSYFLEMEINSPSGWDGKRVQAFDNHSHMQYVRWSPSGFSYLPDTHPYLIPAIQIKPMWRIGPEVGDPKKLHYSSDLTSPGDTMHFEYIEGWHPATKQAWHDNIINGFLTTGVGNLGDGRCLSRPPCFTFSVANNVITPDANGLAQIVDQNGVRL